MAADEVRLAYYLRTGDVAGAREMIREGKTGGMSGGEMLEHAVQGDMPGVARMLCCEGAVDVAATECNDELLSTRHVACEMLAVGMAPPAPSTPLERALSRALLDARASLVASGGMMRAAESYPATYRRLLEVAGETPSGREMLEEVFSALALAEREDTPATR